jgi:hypothetical protein
MFTTTRGRQKGAPAAILLSQSRTMVDGQAKNLGYNQDKGADYTVERDAH